MIGIIFVIPSIVDVGNLVNEQIYESSSKNDIMTNVYQDNKITFFILGIGLLLIDVFAIIIQVKKGNW